MKNRLLLIIAAFTAVISTGRAADPGPLNFNFRMVGQLSLGMTSTTNVSRTATNIVSYGSYVTTNVVLDDQMLLKMLANSFATNLPTNATVNLAGGGGGVAIMEGTNLVLDASPVLRISSGIDGTNYTVYNGSSVFRETINKKGDNNQSTGSDHATLFATIEYDDSAFPTRDGNTTRFEVTGVEDFYNNESLVGLAFKKYVWAFRFIGTGRGSFSNSVSQTTLIVSGGFTATISGGQ